MKRLRLGPSGQPIRAHEILTGRYTDYKLTPIAFYRDVMDMTGLKPVFIG